MDLITIVMFIMIFALCVLFSVFAIGMEKAEWSFLAMVTWFAFAILNIGFATDPLFYVLSDLYWILGMIFMIFGIRNLLLSFRFKREQREEEEQFGVE